MRAGSVFEHSDSPRRHRDSAVRAILFWRRAVILGAVLSLTINVATRYCQVNTPEAQAMKALKSQSLGAERQHLLNDGLHWSVPEAALVLSMPARVVSGILAASFPITRLRLEDCVYSRPPPFC
jgi:hypothetical protein